MISLVIPAFNEADKLEACVSKTRNALKKIGIPFEIIIAEDGSTDGTNEVAEKLSKKFVEVKHFHSDEKLGRGKALSLAFSKSRGELLAYMDVDLATDLTHLNQLIQELKNYDVVIGSRYLPESKASRTLERRIFSLGYNLFIRVLLGSRVHDHQCGFKGFRKKVFTKINKKLSSTHWFWDTEFLVLAQRNGYSIKEIPVNWEEKGRKGKSKVNIKKDVLDMGLQAIKLWLKLNFKKI